MKNVFVYVVIFLLTFALVSGAIFYMNSKYKNVFALDFTPDTGVQLKNKNEAPSTDTLSTETATLPDTGAVAADLTMNEANEVNTALTEPNINNTTTIAKQPLTENPMLPKTNNKDSAKKDSVYQAWLRDTVKLYEAMDSKKVAKVILAYPDNIARDLILRMRKKKAAEVLSEFQPEVVTRLISVN
ncbi:MAG: hypothetical protein FD143_1776 [Ignavibacteria bacterium]|nr:MAG: hypothetical protein FD143_1776 [Ignavibacteria bacterium]KAF0160122.1 MAG: hypothetical protein FD188_1936 [Ignavibacteria bacterium]